MARLDTHNGSDLCLKVYSWFGDARNGKAEENPRKAALTRKAPGPKIKGFAFYKWWLIKTTLLKYFLMFMLSIGENIHLMTLKD